jgi:hypothetical protein
MWSLLLSTGIAVALLVFLELKNGGCWIFDSGQAVAFICAGFVWLLVSAFFLLPWWGRIVLLLLVLVTAGAIFTTNFMHSRIAAIQASAVGRVRTMQGLLEVYKEKHPGGGFPAVLPMIEPNWHTERHYRFEYEPIRTKTNGPAEDYVLRATPIRPECGCTMRLITSKDSIIHWNFENRPATRADPSIDQ